MFSVKGGTRQLHVVLGRIQVPVGCSAAGKKALYGLCWCSLAYLMYCRVV
jgi:hypothetical protein